MTKQYLLLSAVLIGGCTGLATDNKPGQDTYLSSGSFAVDEETETTFVMKRAKISENSEKKEMYAITTGNSVKKLGDFSTTKDERIAFTQAGVTIFAESNGKDEILVLDRQTLIKKTSKVMPGRYHGTRTSPSRAWIAVANNSSSKLPIHIIDANTLALQEFPHNGTTLEANWANNSDTLYAIVFYPAVNAASPYARVMSWAFNDVAKDGFTTSSEGFWSTKPTLDIKVDGVTEDYIGSYTWVTVSPDDKWAAFSVRKQKSANEYSYQVALLDVEKKSVSMIDNVRGPVGFTPDSSTVIGYRDVTTTNEKGETESQGQKLVFIDGKSLAVTPIESTITDGIKYFITREGNHVVIASAFLSSNISVLDITTKKLTSMPLTLGSSGLNEFVSRIGKSELWFLGVKSMTSLNFVESQVLDHPLSFQPAHINILPKRDELVLDDKNSNVIRFFSPSKKQIVREAKLQ